MRQLNTPKPIFCRRGLVLAAASVLFAASLPRATAEIVVLNNGGRLRGEMVASRSSDRDKYTLKAAAGLRVTLDKSRVAKVVRQSAAELEYERMRPGYPDTVDGQWQLAEWCRKHHLASVRQTHLARIIELDPNHQAARRGLGYSQMGGRWVTQQEVMTERGYVSYRGQWRLPQEVELLERKHKDTAAEKQWLATLNRWHEWLRGDRADEAIAKIRAIDDPYALKAIQHQLSSEPNQQVRLWYLEALDRIGTPPAVAALVQLSLFDPVDEVRLTAVDYLVEKKHPEVVAMYIQSLRHASNDVINRAAYGLGRLGNPAAVAPLVDALITTHKFKVVQGSPGISSTFATPGPGAHAAGADPHGLPAAPAMGGLSTGQTTTIVATQARNTEVLDALIKLTGVNFDYDVSQWKGWLAARKKGESLDARRD